MSNGEPETGRLATVIASPDGREYRVAKKLTNEIAGEIERGHLRRHSRS
jgi:hypothetical protein